MTFPRPQTQKILVLQSVQFRVAGNSWGYGCSIFCIRSFVFQVDFDFYYSGWLFAVGFHFSVCWASYICVGIILFIYGRVYRVLGILYLYRVYSFVAGRVYSVLGIL